MPDTKSFAESAKDVESKNAACTAEMANLLRTDMLLVVRENISSTVTFVERYFGQISIWKY